MIRPFSIESPLAAISPCKGKYTPIFRTNGGVGDEGGVSIFGPMICGGSSHPTKARSATSAQSETRNRFEIMPLYSPLLVTGGERSPHQ